MKRTLRKLPKLRKLRKLGKAQQQVIDALERGATIIVRNWSKRSKHGRTVSFTAKREWWLHIGGARAEKLREEMMLRLNMKGLLKYRGELPDKCLTAPKREVSITLHKTNWRQYKKAVAA